MPPRVESSIAPHRPSRGVGIGSLRIGFGVLANDRYCTRVTDRMQGLLMSSISSLPDNLAWLCNGKGLFRSGNDEGPEEILTFLCLCPAHCQPNGNLLLNQRYSSDHIHSSEKSAADSARHLRLYGTLFSVIFPFPRLGDIHSDAAFEFLSSALMQVISVTLRTHSTAPSSEALARRRDGRYTSLAWTARIASCDRELLSFQLSLRHYRVEEGSAAKQPHPRT
ncbi:hypothetical protein VTO73DRAFT_11199 [Trametes versicolor]